MNQNSKQDKYPLRTELLALTAEDRYAAICDYIHSSLVQSFAVNCSQLGYGDFAVLVEELGFSTDQVDAAKEALFQSFKKDLNIHFYYFEKKIGSIRALAKIIDQNIIELFSPPQAGPASEPFFSEKYWPWQMNNIRENPDRNSQDITFVLSCPRSGSTIFRLILAAHPQLFAPPELHLLPFASMGSMADEIKKNGFEWMGDGVAEALVEAQDLSHDESYRRVNAMAENDMRVADVYRHIQKEIGDRILVDKTPFYSCHPQWLNHAAVMFPKAKFIFLTRHPVGMINSFVKLRLKALTHDNFGCDDENPWHLGEKWWLNGNQNISDFVVSLPKNKSLLLRYEDLIRDTRLAMAEVCRFLNLDFDERVLNPYAETSEITKIGIGDPNILNHSTIDVSLADNWKNKTLPHPLSRRSTELANQLGYQLDV